MAEQEGASADAGAVENMRPRNAHWTEAEITELRRLFFEGLKDPAVGLRLGRTSMSVQACRRRLGLEGLASHNARAMPADFAGVAATKNNAELKRIYKTCNEIVGRWRRESGIPSPGRTYARKAVAEVVRPERQPALARKVSKGNWRPWVLPAVPAEVVEQAAHYLRRSLPVYRAKTADPSAPADLWVVGTVRMDGAAVIAKARAKGFDRIAA